MSTDATKVAKAFSLNIHNKGDVFAVACGLYWYCADYHGGQWSEEYRILSTIDYKPGAGESGPEKESTDRDVYEVLAGINGWSQEFSALDAEAFVKEGLEVWDDD